MTSAKKRWAVRLAKAAGSDFQEIIAWTDANFGSAQAETYSQTLSNAIESLVEGPHVTGVRPREDIGPGVFALHVRRGRQKGRHFILFRIGEAETEIRVLRILHDRMDLARHIGSSG